MTLYKIVQASVGLLFLGHVLLGIASFGQQTCEAIIPANTTSHLGDKAVIKCRQSIQNIAWTFCSKTSGPQLIATNCELTQSAPAGYSLDKSNGGCNLVIDNVNLSHYGSYTCQDLSTGDPGHTVELANTDENLALGKNTIQSSTYVASTPSNVAVDGNPAVTSCSMTFNYAPEWWAVDLGQETAVGHVRVTNRPDQYYTRLANFFIATTNVSPWINAPSLSKSSICKYYTGIPPSGVSISIYCEPDVKPGRYLYVMMTQAEYLCFCELEVYYK